MVIAKKEYSDIISEIVTNIFFGQDKLMVLEAGCGSRSHIVFPKETYNVGIDISSEGLGKNHILEEKILGDIQTYPLPADHFDVVICWDVIEHLPKPILALKNLFRTTKIGGVIILAYPNLISLKGIATKFSPYFIHKLYYRSKGFSSTPFPTYFRYSIIPSKIERLAIINGFSVELNLLYGGNDIKLLGKHKLLKNIYNIGLVLLNLFTLFKYDFSNSECIMILKKIK